MVEKDLKTYIQRELEKGFTPMRIKNHLYKHGYENEEIEEAMKQVEHDHPDLLVDKRFDPTQ